MRIVVTLIGLATGIYVLLGLALYVMQERMVFLPQLPGRELDATPRRIGLDYVDVKIETVDGIWLHGWYVFAKHPRGVVLFLHGNAGNISHRLDSVAIFNALELDTFIIDYRGYGRSEGKPSEHGTYRDAEAAWQYLVDDRGEAPARIFIFGRSIGGAVAAWLASKHEHAGVIIESSFTSAVQMASQLYPFMPVRWLVRLQYPVVDYLANAKSPVLVVHSRDDEIIPFAMGEALYDVAPTPKAFLELAGDHNSGFLMDRDRYREGLARFVAAHLQGDAESHK